MTAIALGFHWLVGCGFVADRADRALDLDLDLDRAQIERMCRVAAKVDAETPGDAGRKLERLAQELARDQLGRAGVALLEALDRVPPGMRRRAVEEVLDRNGLDGLRCPPLERILFR